jgi:hypothetical protein
MAVIRTTEFQEVRLCACTSLDPSTTVYSVSKSREWQWLNRPVYIDATNQSSLLVTNQNGLLVPPNRTYHSNPGQAGLDFGVRHRHGAWLFD